MHLDEEAFKDILVLLYSHERIFYKWSDLSLVLFYPSKYIDQYCLEFMETNINKPLSLNKTPLSICIYFIWIASKELFAAFRTHKAKRLLVEKSLSRRKH